jgi:3-dehydro-4-phosphotetronate decarboxylase
VTAGADLRESICRFGRSLFERGLTPGSSGNISVRLEDGGWLVTPTNASLGFLDPARLSRLDASGMLISGDAPTKEIPLHAALYETRPNDRAIVHLHSTNCVAVSMLPGLDPADVLPPLTAYFLMRAGRTALVPYFRPGAPEIAEAIRALDGRYAALLLANHGPILAAPTLDTAIYGIEELEETAKLFLMVRALNPNILTPDQIRDLVAAFNLPADLAEQAERHHGGTPREPVGFLSRHLKGS